MPKLRVGIIGPGKVTQHMLQHIEPIADSLESIALYNRGSALFEKKYKAHERTLSKILGNRKKKINLEKHNDFNSFMMNSNVIIYNVGESTPPLFLQDGKISPQFEELEGILGLEAQKKDQLPVPGFIAAYYILKEFKAVQEQGYFDDPFRTLIRLPANLPITVQYAHKMKGYFGQKNAKPPQSKFLIVNANSSENNLDAILGVIPGWKDSAVSLAIDQERLNALFNTDENAPKLGGGVITLGIVGDHDSYIIPVLKNLKVDLSQPEDQRRIEAFKREIQKFYQEKYSALQKETRRYFIENKEVENLTADAGRGVISILQAIIGGNSLTSGYFRDLSVTPVGEKYGLQRGEGLCLVDEYRIEREEGRFEIVPQPQELDEKAREGFLKCQEAHIKLHQRFVQNPLIPVHTFPGTADQQPASTAQSVVELYRTMKRRHTEILVPVICQEGTELKQKLIALDLSSLEKQKPIASNLSLLERREVIFEGRNMNDLLRCVKVINLDGKERIAAGFSNDYVLIDPLTFSVTGGQRISYTPPREAPREEKTYRINSIVGKDGKAILSHTLFGVIACDSGTKEEKRLYDPKKADGAIRSAVVNPYDENLYAIVGNAIKCFSSEKGTILRTFASPNSPELEKVVFDGEHLYVSSDRNNRGNSYIYHAATKDDKKEVKLERLSFPVNGDILEMNIFSREGNTYLLYSNGGRAWLAQVERDAQGNPASLDHPQSFHPHRRMITGNRGGVGGLAVGVHGYVSYGLGDPHQPQTLHEIDLRKRECCLLYNFTEKGEYILPTIALLNTWRDET